MDGTTITVNTSKYKTLTHTFALEMKINTRNILFVGAGAFEKVKPTELAIELQGRMPIQAKMEALTREDFIKILRDTDNNLLLQTIELLKTEGVNVVFDGASEAVEEMAQVAAELNEEDNIGARRLRTVVDAVLEDINYEAPDFEHKDSL